MAVAPNNLGLRQRGFTLLELMVVLVIIGVMAGMVSLAVSGANPVKELEQQALNIRGLAQELRKQAIFHKTAMAVEFESDGYRFVTMPPANIALMEADALSEGGDGANDNAAQALFDEGEGEGGASDWSEIEGDETFKAREIPENMQLIFTLGEEPLQNIDPNPSDFDQGNSPDPTDNSNRLIFYPGGESVDFELEVRLNDDEVDAYYTVKGNSAGQLAIEGPF